MDVRGYLDHRAIEVRENIGLIKSVEKLPRKHPKLWILLVILIADYFP